jgi:hypothetical protein
MTPDEKREVERLNHRIDGLQQTVFDLGDHIAEKDEVIKDLRVRNKDLIDKVREMLAQ